MGHSGLPLGNRPVRNIQFFRQLRLRQLFLLAALGNKFSDFCLIHRVFSFRFNDMPAWRVCTQATG